MKKKIVYLGNKNIGYNCLKLLHKNSDILNFEIIGVATSNYNNLMKNFLNKTGLNILSYEIPNCDIIISVQHNKILSKKEINKARERAVNLHMAPLPEYRGCNQFSFAIIDEVNEFGTTIHEIEASIDSGPIIAEKRFFINNNLWVKDLYELTEKESLTLFEETLPILISGDYNPINQNDLLNKRKSSFHFRDEIDKLKNIDLSWNEKKIKKYIRATMMPGFENPYTEIAGKKIHFKLNEN